MPAAIEKKENGGKMKNSKVVFLSLNQQLSPCKVKALRTCKRQ